MALKEIEEKILAQAKAEAEKIKAEGKAKAEELNKEHNQKLQALKAKLEDEAKEQIEALRRSILVPARLQAKKALLEEKQKIIGGIYDGVAKEKSLSVAEINQLRDESEVKVANVLFGA